MNVVITGTSRGIGLALTRAALAEGHEVLAVARARRGAAGGTPPGVPAGETARLHVLDADVGDAGAASAIAEAAQRLGAIDLLVNNAGVLSKTARREDFVQSFAVNTIAPFEITSALLPLLRKSGAPRVVHVTSKMGSIADNTSGGYYEYRASKAALNMISRSLARDHDWLVSLVVHPGWVQTDMGGDGAPVSVADSAAGIWRLATAANHSHSGRFFDYQSNELPW